MTFISGAQGNIAHGPKGTATLATLGVQDLQPHDFSAGGATGTGHTGAGGQTPDPGSKVKGGLSLDDPHGPKTVEGVFKPNG
ncbi:hypothetical protein JQ597_00075 [Bradyrhizobium sp. AUGA SZCCT0177]|uniref:hypothetical protein n=1 Tax=Bradyrhizobium sp. AUGA SZCCT0177 TaxID=2807665 RepID=UPI001BAA7001|nr:hypothetical protein [Bradyrhizobium sp. AUGA SZCCT0177]MBR1280447.1 hypothetical protein [Bradyrhizobium sp. AUGA SZCCT0177]